MTSQYEILNLHLEAMDAAIITALQNCKDEVVRDALHRASRACASAQDVLARRMKRLDEDELLKWRADFGWKA